MPIRRTSPATAAIALALSLGLSACGGATSNRSLYSVNQPVVTRDNYTLDVAATPDGLSIPERQRLAGWFETLNLRYGDRVAIDAPYAGKGLTDDVANLAGRHGLLLSDGAPVTEGVVPAGAVRIVVTRSRAHVPGCPNWSEKFNSNLGNATSGNFGCATNSNLAAMVANPEHLLRGAEGTGETVVMSSTKAIDSYREQKPTGAGGLSQVSSQSAGGAGQ